MNAGISRNLRYAFHRKVFKSLSKLDCNHLVYRTCFTEVLLCIILAQHDTRLILERCTVAGDWKIKHVKEVLAAYDHLLLEELVVDFYLCAETVNPDMTDYFRKVIFKSGPQWVWGNGIPKHLLLTPIFFNPCPVNPVDLGVKPIEGPLVVNVEGNQHTAEDAEAKPEDVDGAVDLVAADGAEGNGEVVSEHRFLMTVK